jgi:hypothetical protein
VVKAETKKEGKNEKKMKETQGKCRKKKDTKKSKKGDETPD